MPIVERGLSENFVRYVKMSPTAHLDDIWSLFPYVAIEQQRCRL
jgi:hypothetical protein